MRTEKLLRLAKEHLDRNEKVLASVRGNYEAKAYGTEKWLRSGLLIATDRRLLFYAKKLLGYELESFDYRHVTSFVVSGNAIMGSKLTFVAAGNDVGVKHILDDVKVLTAEVRNRMAS